MPNADIRIAIMARAPRAGFAKTRLIPELGAHGAAVLAERLLERAVETAVAAGIGAGAGTGVVLGTRGEPAVIPAETVIAFTLSESITVEGD